MDEFNENAFVESDINLERMKEEKKKKKRKEKKCNGNMKE